MWNVNTLSSPDDISAEQRYLLSEDIAAMELIPSVGDEPDLGLLSRIPEGAEIEYCGQGFNEQTVKVRWRGKLYFVFLEDLETQRKPAARCACC